MRSFLNHIVTLFAGGRGSVADNFAVDVGRSMSYGQGGVG